MNQFKNDRIHSKAQKRISLRIQLLIAFTVVIVTLLLLISGLIGYQLKKNSRIHFTDTVSQNLILIGNSVKELFANTESVLTMLSLQEEVQNADDSLYSHVATTEDTKMTEIARSPIDEKIRRSFKNAKASFPNYVEVYMGTKWGGFTSNHDGYQPAGFDPRKRGWYKDAAEANGETAVLKAFRRL